MDLNALAQQIIQELLVVADSDPHERLPKEEQTRCITYAALRPAFRSVCAERGYCSVDEGELTECDLWARNPGEPPLFMEIKHAWSASAYNSKPSEQLGNWLADLGKLREVGEAANRYFLLVGFFDEDPKQNKDPRPKSVLANIQRLLPKNLVHSESAPFKWRGEVISHLAIWVWHWPAGESMASPI